MGQFLRIISITPHKVIKGSSNKESSSYRVTGLLLLSRVNRRVLGVQSSQLSLNPHTHPNSKSQKCYLYHSQSLTVHKCIGKCENSHFHCNYTFSVIDTFNIISTFIVIIQSTQLNSESILQSYLPCCHKK